MSSYLIIDGYNLIYKIHPLLKASYKSIDFARDKLLNMVEAFCDYYDTEGIIVYDGNRKRRAIEEGNPMVIFSASGEDADTVIEGLVYKLHNKSQARVVTDDRVVTSMVIGMGAFTMGALLFETEARHAIESIRKNINDE